MTGVRVDTIDQLKTILASGINYIRDGKILYVDVRPWKDSISRNQQCYYFGVILPALLAYHKETDDRFTTYDIEDYDVLMRTSFYYSLLDVEGKEPLRLPKRLAFGKANKKEVISYFDKLIAYAAQNGIVIPHPDDIGYNIEYGVNDDCWDSVSK